MPTSVEVYSPLTESASVQVASLRTFIERVNSLVVRLEATWVIAEVVQVVSKDKYYRFHLAENDAFGKPAAKAEAMLWRNSGLRILEEFQEATGEAPKAGMRILVCLKARVHSLYGFDFEILDIDPSFTLGEIEKNLRDMRQKLKEAEIYDRNRALQCPTDFLRVAVISPDQAAALGDFRETSDRLENAGLCSFTYQSATFQGPETAESIVNALKIIVRQHKEQPFCAVCIIRGGGATTDLAHLNQYLLAHAICHVPMPIMTGIGHERDFVLIDELVCQSFATPSKVVSHIEQAILTSARASQENWDVIQREANRLMKDAQSEVERLREAILSHASRIIVETKPALDRDYQTVTISVNRELEKARLIQEAAWQSICENAFSSLQDAREALQSDMEQVIGLGPRHTLARGFAIIRDGQDRVVTTREAASTAADLIVEFNDGRLGVRRNNNE